MVLELAKEAKAFFGVMKLSIASMWESNQCWDRQAQGLALRQAQLCDRKVGWTNHNGFTSPGSPRTETCS
jgi:hypothetical protein